MTMRKVPKRVGSIASARLVTLLVLVVETMAGGVEAGKPRLRALAFISIPRRSGHAAGSAMPTVAGALRLTGLCVACQAVPGAQRRRCHVHEGGPAPLQALQGTTSQASIPSRCGDRPGTRRCP